MDYGLLPHAELYRMRGLLPPNDMQQGILGPLEHRAFARELAQEKPFLAALSLPFAIPAYSLAKLLGAQKARTPASMDEIWAGYQGLLEGLNGRTP